MQHAYGRKPHGFTLIELLVVISIISILIAILLPALAKAREASQRTVCISKIRQMSLAVTNYGIDYNDRYPARPGTFNYVSETYDMLGSYVQQTRTIFGSTNGPMRCPSQDLVPLETAATGFAVLNGQFRQRTSYNLSGIIQKTGGTSSLPAYYQYDILQDRPMSNVVGPSSTVWLYEGAATDRNQLFTQPHQSRPMRFKAFATAYAVYGNFWNGGNGYPYWHHGIQEGSGSTTYGGPFGNTSLAFFDGHVVNESWDAHNDGLESGRRKWHWHNDKPGP